MGRKEITVDEERIVTLYKKGLTLREIAKIQGVSYQTVRRRLIEKKQKRRQWMLVE